MKGLYGNDDDSRSLFQYVNEKKEKKGASENATKIDSNKFSLGISKPSNVLRQSATLVPDTSSRDWNTSFQSMCWKEQY